MGKIHSDKREMDDTGVFVSKLDPVVVDYLAKFARARWVQNELEKKVNGEVYKLQFETIKKDISSLNSIVSEHKTKISKAPKRYEMVKLETTLTGWSGGFKKLVFGFVFFLVGAGSTAVWNYSALNSKVDVTTEDVRKMSISIDELKKTQKSLEEKVVFYKSALQYNTKKQNKGDDN